MIGTRRLTPGSLLAGIAALVLLSLATLACSDPAEPDAGTRYQLRAVNGQPLPALLKTDPSWNYFGYVDSASVELVDFNSGFISFAMHEVVYLENGDSLMGGWSFRARARLQVQDNLLIIDYRDRLFQPVYGWDFMGIDTAVISRGSLVIYGDTIYQQPRTVYSYTRH
jgi:hypothetical protein